MSVANLMVEILRVTSVVKVFTHWALCWRVVVAGITWLGLAVLIVLTVLTILVILVVVVAIAVAIPVRGVLVVAAIVVAIVSVVASVVVAWKRRSGGTAETAVVVERSVVVGGTEMSVNHGRWAGTAALRRVGALIICVVWDGDTVADEGVAVEDITESLVLAALVDATHDEHDQGDENTETEHSTRSVANILDGAAATAAAGVCGSLRRGR